MKRYGYYTRQYLMAHGVPERNILECAESANTIQDAQLVRPIVRRHEMDELIVVTSDFHIPRAKFLFEREFPDLRLSFSAAQTHLPEAELGRLKEHEAKALARLKQNDVVTEVLKLSYRGE